MPFPELKPTTRAWDAGRYPVKFFRAQNGAEVRILYGNKKSEKNLQLTYQNIRDAEADLFFDHYDEVKGQMILFTLNQAARNGWEGKAETLGGSFSGLQWRYASPPRIESVFKGRCTVTVSLIAVPIAGSST